MQLFVLPHLKDEDVAASIRELAPKTAVNTVLFLSTQNCIYILKNKSQNEMYRKTNQERSIRLDASVQKKRSTDTGKVALSGRSTPKRNI